MCSSDTPEITPDSYEPEPFHIAGTMYFPVGASVSTAQCICCGRPAIKSVSKALRWLPNIASWYVKRPTLEIGLCKKHLENHRVALALTYSTFGMGLVFVIAGAVTWSVAMLIIGLVMVALCGAFRASATIQGIDVGDETYQIVGAHPRFVEKLVEHEVVEDQD